MKSTSCFLAECIVNKDIKSIFRIQTNQLILKSRIYWRDFLINVVKWIKKGVRVAKAKFYSVLILAYDIDLGK